MLVPNRHSSSDSYRYGFNGKEDDDEIMGEGNFQDYGMLMYNTRLGRFFNVDPLISSYPMLTPFQFASNTPMQAIDLDGLERLDVISYNPKTKETKIQIVKNIYIDKNNVPEKYKNLDANKINTIFKQGNCELYAYSLPKNGEELNFTTVDEYNAGTAYKINVTYDVNLFYVDDIQKINSNDALNTTVIQQKGGYSSTNTPARAWTGNINRVFLNPDYSGLNYSEDIDTTNQVSFEEIIAHEVGIHNMAGIIHKLINNKAFYPTYKTLESNIKTK